MHRSVHRHTLPVVGLIVLFTAPTVRAQDPGPAVLPDIAPREVEIRGTLEVSLPSLQRRVLEGFNPPPEVPSPAVNRRPFLESFDEHRVFFPRDPLPPAEPPTSLGASDPPAYGRFETSLGRYVDRSVRTYLQAPLGDRVQVIAHANYRGRYGHQPFEARPEIRSLVDAIVLGGGIRTFARTWTLGLDVRGFTESYDLYGRPLSADSAPIRRGSSLDGHLTLETAPDVPLSARLDIKGASTAYTTESALETEPNDRLHETRLDIESAVAFPVSAGDVWLKGSVSRGARGIDLGAATTYAAGGGLSMDANPKLQVRVGAMVLGDIGGKERGEIAVAPYIRADLYPMPGLRLYVGNFPRATATTVASLFRENPYVHALPELAPTLAPIDSELGATLYLGPLQFSGRGGLRIMPQYRYFEALSETEQHTATPRYAHARIFHAGGSSSIVLPGGIHAMIDITFRRGQLHRLDSPIPYFAPILAQSTMSVAFARRRGRIQLRGYYESARPIDRAESIMLDGYADLDIEISYRVTTHVGILLRMENIAGSQNARWAHYAEPPGMIGVGVYLRW